MTKRSKRIPVSDYLEDLIDDAITDQDWETSEFFQDVLEACLKHEDKVARNALRHIGCMLPSGEGCLYCNG